eukprot:TRINITY_DN17984_c0_g1_i2.p1 TRINITY_DN17984_c0_g1~~TRINITY_DN17984_c0_g1_i2.p1  ORF type:complete len:166 (-),score=38.40 TRINITY_DN17984_c0_g1_i2:118-615(-)
MEKAAQVALTNQAFKRQTHDKIRSETQALKEERDRLRKELAALEAEHKTGVGPLKTLHEVRSDEPVSYATIANLKVQMAELQEAGDDQVVRKLFKIVKDGCPAACTDSGDSIEIDVEVLDPRTTRQLQEFCDGVAAKKKRKLDAEERKAEKEAKKRQKVKGTKSP